MKKMISGRGGMMGYVGTTNMGNIIEMAKTDAYTSRVLDAFHYQIAKEIGSMAVVLKGKVDRIILTGGISYNQCVVDALQAYVNWIAPITVYPGEDELLALTQGALRVLNGEEEAKVY